ncbi:hypothetical protein SteCoe_36880 [Stentor coeruleus]|uniref:Uncharacterized protein n=1 Tax=Stentor coeruleus TaxID=5963 RepID=A0A1R2AP45_9CILI|nr:hypothetical protein SteCoe_36880 [Stentor coeruleus]
MMSSYVGCDKLVAPVCESKEKPMCYLLDNSMPKRCLKAGCDKEVAFVCECKGKPIFMCMKHPSEHLVLKSNHQIVGLLYRPDPEEAKEICKKFPDVLSKIRKIKSQALESAKMIIEQTLNLSNKLIKNIEEIENRFCKMFKNIKSNREIDIQDNENFINLADGDVDHMLSDLEIIKKDLMSFYDIDPFIGLNYVLYCTDSPGPQLLAINLSNHTQTPLSLKNKKDAEMNLNIEKDKQMSLQISSGFYLCSVNKFTNCIINSQCAYIIDLKQNSFRLIPNISMQNGICGLAYKDDTIYAFGHYNYQNSYKIKLSTMKLENISSPPFYNNYGMQGTSSLFNDNIVVASISSDGLYHYNDTQYNYTNIFNISVGNYKYPMQNWILSSDNQLYENTGTSLNDFKSYANSISIGNLSVYGSFPYKGYIYFISESYSLMRINCAQKKIEIIQYKNKP